MLTGLKFVVEQWVLFMVQRQTWQVRRFEIFESARHFRIKSNRDVRFEFELNLEASQVPSIGCNSMNHNGRQVNWLNAALCWKLSLKLKNICYSTQRDQNYVSTRPPHLSSTLCDLNLWPPAGPWTTCANWHQNQFHCFKNMFTRKYVKMNWWTDAETDGRTDERTDSQSTIIPQPASLAWWGLYQNGPSPKRPQKF